MGKSRAFSKQFFSGRVKSSLEGIDGIGGYNRGWGPVPVFDDSCLKRRRSSKGPCRALENFERMAFQARPH